jgi:hypothetical protein
MDIFRLYLINFTLSLGIFLEFFLEVYNKSKVTLFVLFVHLVM